MNAIPPAKLSTGLHFGVPMEHYLGDLCAGVSVSGSTLFTLHESCPAKALAGHYLSPWGRAEKTTDDTEIGTAAHTLILEGPEVFAERYAVKDVSFSTKEGKAWRAENEGKLFIDVDDYETVAGMRRAVELHPAARNAFTDGSAEVTAITQDAETGLWIKVRPDWLRKGLAINYKTTKSAALRSWTHDATKYGYHVSAALAVDVLKDLGEPAHYAFLTQEKEPPYLIAVRVLDDAFLEAGRMIYRHALRTFAECLAANRWPGYGEETSTVPIPGWLDHQMANLEL